MLKQGQKSSILLAGFRFHLIFKKDLKGTNFFFNLNYFTEIRILGQGSSTSLLKKVHVLTKLRYLLVLVSTPRALSFADHFTHF